MSFEPSNAFIGIPYAALSNSTGKIPYDISCISEVTYPYQTNTAPVIGGAGEDPTYNGIETMFDIRVPGSSRVMFAKSYLRVTGYAANMAVSKAAPVPLGTSIPWNTLCMFNTAELTLNQNATTTELINQNLGDSMMMKFLTKYSREAIESMDDSLFTPTIEEIRDRGDSPTPGSTYLSETSQRRRLTQLVNDITSTQKMVSKNIYLCDLFESLRTPSGFFVQNVQVKITPKLAHDILIKDLGCLGPTVASQQKFFITGLTLNLVMTQLTENQMMVERDRILNGREPMLRQAFHSYDAVQKSHTQGASYRDSNVKSMQAAILLFPSTLAADGVGCNRYQYCYGSGVGGVTGLSTYQMRYDNVYSPAQPLVVSTTHPESNTPLYAQYRLLSRKMSDRDISLAVPFRSFAVDRNEPVDESPYVMFMAQFYPQDTAGHRMLNGADHEVITSGGATEPIVIVRIRLSFLEIRGDASISIIN
jgi:hypothetical protein